MFGNPETTTGGRALKFYSSIRIEIRKVNTIKGNDNVETGNRVKAKVVKNKLAPPFRSAEFDILFNEGISRHGSAIDVGVEMGIVEKKGTWLGFKGNRFQGREMMRVELKKNEELTVELEKQILQNGPSKLNQMESIGSAAEDSPEAPKELAEV
jgi:recombination protein RecA